MRLAVKVRVDGTHERVDLDAPEGSLKVLQSAVEGWVQAIDLREDLTMWLNEEGKLEGKPVNMMASRFFNDVFGAGHDIMVGNAIFTGGVDNEGDTIGLTDEQAEEIEARADESQVFARLALSNS